MRSDFWVSTETNNRRFLIAIGLGLLLEIGAVSSVLVFEHMQPPPSDKPTVIKLSITAPAPPAPKPPPPPPVVPPKPVPPPPVPVTPPIPMPPPPPVPHHTVTHKPPPPKHVDTPPPVTPPPVDQPPPAPTPPQAPPAPSAGELDLFRAAMRTAVRQAARTPSSAAMAHEFGIARVSFNFQDGAVSNIAVVTSSGYPLLDQAAMQAVRDAHYPPVPPDMVGHADSVQVDVIFRPVDTAVDSD
ncbi:MAG TPA: energy transducer TonB [Acidocella sp.]|nr:energy transducer TonB [Acidocella sp.]